MAIPSKCSAAVQGATASRFGPEGAMAFTCQVALTTDVLLTQARTPARLVLLRAVGRRLEILLSGEMTMSLALSSDGATLF